MPRPDLISPGERVPEFSLPAADNSIWSWRHLARADRVLLVCYRRECRASRLLLPFVERMHRRLGTQVRIAGIAQDSHRDTLEAADAFQITFPLLLDHPRLALSRELGVTQVPAQLLLGGDGEVLFTLCGFSRSAQDQLFLRLARELGRAEVSLFHAGDLIADEMPASPSATMAPGADQSTLPDGNGPSSPDASRNAGGRFEFGS